MTPDRSELGTNIAATDVNMKYYLPSVIEPICLPSARIARCGDAGPGWHKLSVRGARGNILNLTHDIFSVMQSDETRDTCVTPDTWRVMQTSWHPPTVSGGSQEASCKFIFMFLLPSTAPPARPGYRSDACGSSGTEANGTVTGPGTLKVFCKAPLTLHQSIISNEHG